MWVSTKPGTSNRPSIGTSRATSWVTMPGALMVAMRPSHTPISTSSCSLPAMRPLRKIVSNSIEVPVALGMIGRP
jgi:hypothetical protein